MVALQKKPRRSSAGSFKVPAATFKRLVEEAKNPPKPNAKLKKLMQGARPPKKTTS